MNIYDDLLNKKTRYQIALDKIEMARAKEKRTNKFLEFINGESDFNVARHTHDTLPYDIDMRGYSDKTVADYERITAVIAAAEARADCVRLKEELNSMEGKGED